MPPQSHTLKTKPNQNKTKQKVKICVEPEDTWNGKSNHGQEKSRWHHNLGFQVVSQNYRDKKEQGTLIKTGSGSARQHKRHGKIPTQMSTTQCLNNGPKT